MRRLFPLPGAAFVTLMLLFPLGYTLYLSVHRWFASSVQPPVFIGAQNYVELFRDARFISSVVKTLYFLSLSITSQLLAGIGLALFLDRKFIGRRVAQTLLLLPMMATPVAMGLVWSMLLDPTIGIVNYFLRVIGIGALPWLADAHLVIPALSLIELWRWTPFVTIIVLAGLAALPAEPFEAARIDGASYAQTIRYITLPLLRPTIMVAVLFRLIDGLKTFDIIAATTAGGPAWASEILYVYTYNQTFIGFHFGYGSAVIVVFAALLIGVTLLMSKIRRAKD